MTAIKSGSGYKIKSHTSGKVYPKVYRTKQAANKRIGQMLKHKSLASAAGCKKR